MIVDEQAVLDMLYATFDPPLEAEVWQAMLGLVEKSKTAEVHPDIARQMDDVRACSNIDRVRVIVNFGRSLIALVEPDAAPRVENRDWSHPWEPYLCTFNAGTH
jgi:hypothetical protein